MTPQLRVAILRGLYNAAGAFAVIFLTVYSQTNDWKKAAVAGGLAALAALGFRGVGEGVYDTGRAYQVAVGKRSPSDADIQHTHDIVVPDKPVYPQPGDKPRTGWSAEHDVQSG